METPANRSPFRALPSADRVLRSPEILDLLREFARGPVVRLVRQELEEYRIGVAAGGPAPDFQTVVDAVVERARRDWVQSPRQLINATGVILHTNLGRAPLSARALAAMHEAAGYSDLEYDLARGGRGSRQDHVVRLLLALTAAQAAHVTVNNAAAVTLALAALARGKEVIVSRGQAVEIGGGFRVPVILRQSGARLVEVGTTNRTRLHDYEAALSPKTAALLHVHSSNFRIVGFAEEVQLADLAQLAHRHDLVLLDDNGSGSLLDTAAYGLAHEPTPLESLQAGVDLVAFSGDKLLGGPQSGILLGRADLLARVRVHPLARAVRPDKTSLAALSATLLTYLHGNPTAELPVWRMISQTGEAVEQRARVFRTRAAGQGLELDLVPGESPVGGGSLPGETLPTTLLLLPPALSARALRLSGMPVIGVTRGDRVLLDLRTVPEALEFALLDALCAAAGPVDHSKRAVLDSGAR